MSKRISQVSDEPAEIRWRLIQQDQRFCRALTAAIRGGRETAAGVTATVRTLQIESPSAKEWVSAILHARRQRQYRCFAAKSSR
jgi:hypothetical protein